MDSHIDLSPYPVDTFSLLRLSSGSLAAPDMLHMTLPAAAVITDDPISIASAALAHWNAYLASERYEDKTAFMTRAFWLLIHRLRLPDSAEGWLVQCSSPMYYASQPCLSALTQGMGISVLVRAYTLTGEVRWFDAAQRAVRTCGRDILDGGINTPIGDEGLFFEEVAVYPAAHILCGHILALFGLYDYMALTEDSTVAMLIQRGIAALHILLDEFDSGYWTRRDLLYRHLTAPFDHALHVQLLVALASYSDCEHCTRMAARWAAYQQRPECQLRRWVTSHIAALYDHKMAPWLRRLIFRITDRQEQSLPARVCVPITAFPVPGGMRGVLAGVAQAMNDRWQMLYLTHYQGPDPEELEVELFGRKNTSPWQFPFVWLYSLAGGVKLCTLLRRHGAYRLVLPQDGVFTGAFAALVGKMAGVRVVCMDHGNVTLLHDPAFRRERNWSLSTYPWPWQFLARLRLSLYWPSQHLLARIATHYTDLFLVAGDEVETVYRERLDVNPSRIVRYAYMVDAVRFAPPERETWRQRRAELGLAEETIVITLINRLAPEKGLQFALEGIAQALSALPAAISVRVRILIAGDGPLRGQVEADIRHHSLEAVSMLLGAASPARVSMLLSISTIFLYSGTRGTNYSVAVLEAMAAGCAVIATTAPTSNAKLLAEGRGMAIVPSDAVAIGTALTRLCHDPGLCHQMGQRARKYVMSNHNTHMLRRSLLRTSFFQPLVVAEDEQSRTTSIADCPRLFTKA